MSSGAKLLSCRFLVLLLSLTIFGGAQGQGRSPEELLPDLQRGGYVILMRHASSPRDPPDAAHLNADNAVHERQLDELGTESARAMGEAIHRLNIPIGAIFSSPTYRAVQTIKLAQLGSVFIIPELGDSGQSMQRDQSGTRSESIQSLSAKLPRRGSNTLIVTHLPNITEAFSQDAHDLAEGEALIIKPDGTGGAPVVARIKIDEWPKLGHAP